MRKINLIIIIIIISIFIIFFAIPYPKDFLNLNEKSIKIYDRNNKLLMELTPGNSGISSQLNLKEVPSYFIDILLFSEDKYFFKHNGIHIPSILRSVFLNIKNGKWVYGGSTITQQVVKIKYNIKKNNFLTKLLEILRAIKLELYYSKEQILEFYLNSVYMGNHLVGVKKASELYLNKDISKINELESAFLITLLKKPSYWNIFKDIDIIENKSKNLLKRYLEFKKFKKDYIDILLSNNLKIYFKIKEFYAPHFCLWALNEAKKIVKNKKISEIYTTLDRDLYIKVLEIVKNKMFLLEQRNANHAAIVIIDNQTMELLLMIGGIDYFGEFSRLNGTTIKRQPGSTLKPFTYALALESKKYNPSSILPDIYLEFPAQVGKYIPRNFDECYHGPVRFAVALGCSYNIPAVYLLNNLGIEKLYNILKICGIESINKSPYFYGLGLTLGNPDITLLELVNAYTVFPRNGFYKKINSIRYIIDNKGNIFYPEKINDKYVFSKETCFLINHILSDFKYKIEEYGVNSPIHFPFPFAVKTGTSKDFRDNFIVGYNKYWTIGLWTGNMDGTPMKNLPASLGSGVILRDIVLKLFPKDKINQDLDENISIIKKKVCKLSGKLANDNCDYDYEYFIIGTEPKEYCDWHNGKYLNIPIEYKNWAINFKKLEDDNNFINYNLDSNNIIKILSPKNGDIFKLDSNIPLNNQQIKLEALKYNNENIIEWFINGKYYSSGNTIFWTPKLGKHVIKVLDKTTGFYDIINIIVM